MMNRLFKVFAVAAVVGLAACAPEAEDAPLDEAPATEVPAADAPTIEAPPIMEEPATDTLVETDAGAVLDTAAVIPPAAN